MQDRLKFRFRLFSLVMMLLLLNAARLMAQSNSGNIGGTVTDPTGAVISGATVTLTNPVSQYTRSTATDTAGHFALTNIPFNPYRLTVTAAGFGSVTQSVDVSSVVGVNLTVKMNLASSAQTVTVVSGADLVENDPNFHTDIDRQLIDKLPLESASSSLSSLVTLSSPGVAADSNGLFHGLGDHAENSFSVDGQPITDQQSKVFSNQLPADAVQSLEVIDGAPPAEYGDKTSLVIVATTRSGQGELKPRGSIAASYGTFGTSNVSGNLSYGGQRWGNFIALSGLQTGRFLDPPEFVVFHDKGNEENIFDRVDYQFNQQNSVHLNFQYTRSWFQTPNDYENLGVQDQFGNLVGNTDQRSKIGTFDVAPSFTHIINTNTVATIGAFVRRDAFNYYPSGNPLADFSPLQQQETVGQGRTLTNMGLHADVSYVHGIHNIKIGGVYEQTLLRESDNIGLVDPTVNSPCVDNTGTPVSGFSDPSQCTGSGLTPNTDPAGNAAYQVPYDPDLLPYDLTRGGGIYHWYGQTDVKQLALYGQDQMTMGNWVVNLGARGDVYNGMTIQRQGEPRAAVSYNVKRTNTVLRISYARTQETPFNENLVLSSVGCANPVLYGIFETLPTPGCTAPTVTPFNPGFRNEFHAGFQQAFGHHLVVSGEYIWKYTHNAYDFSVLGTTPITFPIEWHNSKIPGFALRANVPETHGFSAFVVMSSVAARFFNPQIGGVGATPGTAGSNSPFRIDHDERYNQTTHLQYNLPFRKSMWYGFNWRYDSGLVAGAAPCYNGTSDSNSPCGTFTLPNGQQGVDLSGLTPDQQFQAGLVCDGVAATPTSGFQYCDNAGFTSKLIRIPAPNTEDDDHNPPRIAPRNLFDMALGDDNLFHNTNGHRIGLRVTAVNVTNKYALYNFLSTFSGTHYVTPRSITGQVSYNF